MAGENTSAAEEPARSRPETTLLERERRGLWGAALGRDTRHGTTEHGMVWVGSTLEIGWAVGRDTFH